MLRENKWMLDKDVSSIQNDVNCYIPLPVSKKDYSKEHSQGENGVVIPPFFFSSLCIIYFVSFCVSSPKHSNHTHRSLQRSLTKKVSMLFYWGALQFLVQKMGWLLWVAPSSASTPSSSSSCSFFHHRRDPPAHSLLLPHQHPYHRQGHQCRRALGSIIIRLLMVIILTITKIIGDNKFLFLSDMSQSAQQLLSQWTLLPTFFSDKLRFYSWPVILLTNC